MIEIRIHGRGGQGAVIASLILARAAHFEGWNVQVFPEFGVERRGVPVTAFARLDRKPIRLRTKVYHPDHLIVLDPALMGFIDVTAGLKTGGWMVLNTPKKPASFSFSDMYRIGAVDATEIAANYGIGTKTSPIVNTTMVGAFSRATDLISMDSVRKAIALSIPGVMADANFEAAKEAYERLLLPMNVFQDAWMRAENFNGSDL